MDNQCLCRAASSCRRWLRRRFNLALPQLSVITFVVPASGAGAATTFHCWQSPASPSDLAENRGRNVAMRTGRVPITNGEWQHTFNLPAVKLHSSRSSGELITYATKAR